MRLHDKFVYGMYATQVTVEANWPLVFDKHIEGTYALRVGH